MEKPYILSPLGSLKFRIFWVIFILKLSFSKPFHNTLNYAYTSNIKVMKFYNLGDKSFETDFSIWDHLLMLSFRWTVPSQVFYDFVQIPCHCFHHKTVSHPGIIPSFQCNSFSISVPLVTYKVHRYFSLVIAMQFSEVIVLPSRWKIGTRPQGVPENLQIEKLPEYSLSAPAMPNRTFDT